MPFAELLARLDGISGLERIRYTSPHPIFFDEDADRASRPSSSASVRTCICRSRAARIRILEAMRRRYTRERYLEITRALRGAPARHRDHVGPDRGLSRRDGRRISGTPWPWWPTPGLVDSFSFKYSPRPGTQAESLGGEVSPEIAQQRLERLQAQQKEQTLAYHRNRVGEETLVLVDGPSRRGGDQLTGRDPHNRVVNFTCDAARSVASGDLVGVRLVDATPHSLLGELLPPP